MAKNNVGKKPISQEEYTTNKVLAVFSVCLLGVLVLMILERLLGYSNTWKTGVLVTRVLLGVGIVGAAAGIIMLGQEHAGKRSSVRRIVCGRNMLIASIVAIVFLTAINYYGTMPIKAMYVVLPVLAVYYLVYHSYAPEFFLIAVDTGVGVAAMLVIHRALVSANHTWMSTVAAAGTAVLALIQIAVTASAPQEGQVHLPRPQDRHPVQQERVPDAHHYADRDGSADGSRCTCGKPCHDRTGCGSGISVHHCGILYREADVIIAFFLSKRGAF